MKKKIIRWSIALSVLIGIWSVYSCSKSSSPSGTLYGNLYFQIQSTVGNALIRPDSVMTDSAGRRFLFTNASFYVCAITLHNANGSSYLVPGVYLLNSLNATGINSLSVGSVPVGTYSYISYSIGVDAAANVFPPSYYAVGSANYTTGTAALGPLTPPAYMNFAYSPNSACATDGYIFMNVQGLADTSAMNNGTVSYPFSVQVGTNNLLTSVTAYKQFSVVYNQNVSVQIAADYGRLFKGIPFTSLSSVSPCTNLPVCTQVSTAIPSMFR